jgi:ABC-type arginine transport system permease subunit
MWARDQNESSVGLFYQTLSKNESIRVRQNKYIFVCVVCVLFFLLTLVSLHSSKKLKTEKVRQRRETDSLRSY